MLKLQVWFRYSEAVAGVAVVTLAGRLLFSFQAFAHHVSITTVALSYLLAGIITSSRRGLGPGIFGSVLGMACFYFFFLPPIYTLTLKDPHDWAALTAFIVTASVASGLWAGSDRREREARWHREQVVKLYRLSCAIIINPDPANLMKSIAPEVLEAFGYRYCGVFQKSESGVWQRVSVACSTADHASFVPASDVIETVYRSGKPNSTATVPAGQTRRRFLKRGGNRSEATEVTTYIPSKAGSNVAAVLVFVSDEAGDGTMDAIASLVALALERARLLAEIQVKESLKQSDKLKSALLASVSHNLRTPLTSIRASVESILAADVDQGNPLLRELHLIISEEVSRLSRIVDHLLEMARVEAGELRLKKERTCALEILDNTLRRCAAAVRHHKVVVDCPETMPLINVDPRMVAEVLTNLIENAAKYSPAGSEITIRAGINGETVRFSVADQGPGIPPWEEERIFDKFYRGTQSTRQNKDGMGMGLAIARGLVEAHSGRIWVEKGSGCGATFVFTVPSGQTVTMKSALEMSK